MVSKISLYSRQRRGHVFRCIVSLHWASRIVHGVPCLRPPRYFRYASAPTRNCKAFIIYLRPPPDNLHYSDLHGASVGK